MAVAGMKTFHYLRYAAVLACTGMLLAHGAAVESSQSTSEPLEVKSADKSGKTQESESRTTDSLCTCPEMVKGNVADNPATSAAVARILSRCAQTFTATQDFHATGTYIEASRSAGSSDSEDAARLEIDYVRPDKLRVQLSDEELSSAFIANGKKVLMLWPSDKKYQTADQPSTLAAYSEAERAGEIFDDESLTMMRSLIPALFISPDPLAWLHANVVQYDYEGIDNVGDSPCWRIRFLQVNPQMAVTNWVDCSSFFLRQVSVVRALDSDGDFTPIYQDSSAGHMRLTILDKISTEPAAVPKDAFSFEVPKDWSLKRTVRADTDEEAPEGQFLALFRAAASQSGKITSVTLTSDPGTPRLKQLAFFPTSERALSLASIENQMYAGLANRQIMVVDPSSKTTRFSSQVRPDLMTTMGTSDSAFLVAADREGHVAACTADGQKKWSADTHQEITGICSGQDHLYTAGAGLVTLGKDGVVQFTSRRFSSIEALAYLDQQDTPSMVVASSKTGFAQFAQTGQLLCDENISGKFLALMQSNGVSSSPLVGMTNSLRGGTRLHGLDAEGTLQWTVGIGQTLAEAKPAGLALMRLKDHDDTTSVGARIVSLVGDGSLALYAGNGQPLWRGRIAPADQAAGLKPETFAHALAATDVNGDGHCEVFVATDAGIMMLGPE